MTYDQLKQTCLNRMTEKGWDSGLREAFFEWLLPAEFKDRYDAELAKSNDLFIRVMDVIG